MSTERVALTLFLNNNTYTDHLKKLQMCNKTNQLLFINYLYKSNNLIMTSDWFDDWLMCKDYATIMIYKAEGL